MYPAGRSNIPEARCTSEVHSGQETYESLQALRIIRRVMVKVIVGSQRKKNTSNGVHWQSALCNLECQ